MKQRGRRSAASLALPEIASSVPRQAAPHDINDEETEVWAAVVNDMPADWFSPATRPLLTQYCRHVVQARRLSEMIERFTSDPEFTLKDYKGLLSMQKEESSIIRQLAASMRLAQQSTINARGNKKPSSSHRLLADF